MVSSLFIGTRQSDTITILSSRAGHCLRALCGGHVTLDCPV
jgi:hypothetical protein